MKIKSFIAAVLVFSSILPMQAIAADYSSLVKPAVRQPSSNESIYFVMTDRFENGDPSNDNAGLVGGNPAGGFDPTDPGYWHGGDLKGLTSHIDYIKSLGFTSMWITPPVKQKYIQSSSAGYHGYWGLDFTTIDPHLGTEADFKELVSQAHANGIKVIIDVVANHTADVIYLENGQPKIYVDELGVKKPDWLNDVTNYHNQGNGSGITQDFYGLDDLATEKPTVVNGWISIWSDWINKFDIDGMRIDTFKYIDAPFWKKVLPAIKAVALKKGKTDFPIFGEIYDINPYTTSSFVTSQQVESVLDFPFQKRVTRFAAYGGNTMELASLFNADDLYTTAKTNASGLITFMGNHDMGRIGYFIRDAVLESDTTGALERAKLANALLFLLRGSPAVYYGDEKGLAGVGGDKQARQDLFATKVIDWQSAQRIGAEPAGTSSLFVSSHPLEKQITELQQIIKNNPALRDGTQQVRTTEGDVFVVTRYANQQEYIVAFNGSDEASSTEFNVSTSGTTWNPLAGSCAIKGDGTISLEVPARSYCLFKSNKKFLPSSKLSVQISVKNIDFFVQDATAVTAFVPGNDYVNVTFSYRKKGGPWLTLGTAEKRTVQDLETDAGLHRVYLYKSNFKVGTNVELIAVAKSANGKTAASKIINMKITK